MRILVLGGTAEARALAANLSAARVSFESSLAGRVSAPRMPAGPVRVGGFGGVDGLARHLRESAVTHLVDATHPFATQISQNAVAAGAAVGVPVLRLARPGWSTRPDADQWLWGQTLQEVRVLAEGAGVRPFITSGRQTLPAFAAWADRDVLVRVVEPLDEPAPCRWTILQDRGPHTLQGERNLLRDNRIDVLVTKDSGGAYTSPKLDAAAEIGVRVVVLARPPVLPGVTSVDSVSACLSALGVGRSGHLH